jgi:small-conductance mechanosensitive channel
MRTASGVPGGDRLPAAHVLHGPAMDWQLITQRLRALDLHLFTLGGVPVTVSSLATVLALLVLLWWFAGWLRRWIVERLLRRTGMDLGTRQAVGSLVRYVVLVVGVVLILQNSGLNLSALGVIAGAVGVGVGFGLQNIVSNFISGLIITMERPIKVGDRIEVGGVEGVVQEIGARCTTVITNDRMAILVPNQRFILDNVINQVYSERPIRLRLPVQVPSSVDPALVRELLREVARAHPQVLGDPAPQVLIIALGGASTSYELAVWHEARGPQRQELLSELAFLVGEQLRSREIPRG